MMSLYCKLFQLLLKYKNPDYQF